MALAAPTPIDYPRGVIVVSIQNQTTGGEIRDANGNDNAVPAKRGDTLKYVIQVTNKGPAKGGDLVGVKLDGSLPKNLSFQAQDARKQRTIKETLGTIKPGEKVIKEYLLTVSAGKDRDVITGEVCFTGDNNAKESPQKGCDHAKIKLDSNRPVILPSTGMSTAVLTSIVAASIVFGYIARLVSFRWTTTKAPQ